VAVVRGCSGLLVLLPLAVPLLVGGMAAWATLTDTSNSPAAMLQSLAWQLALSVLYLVVVPRFGGNG
jgi:ABC-type transport system involved in cytochrome c biogenesis permease component